MCPVFFCADFWDGAWRGGADAVGVFGCGVRIWSQWQTKFGRKSHFLSASEPREPDLELAVEHFSNFGDFVLLRSPRGADLDAVVDKIRQNSPFFVYLGARVSRIWMRE